LRSENAASAAGNTPAALGVSGDTEPDLTWGFLNEEDFRAQLENGREMVDLAAREVEERTRREAQLRELRELRGKERQRELQKSRLLNQARIRKAEERRADARRKEEAMAQLAAVEQGNRIGLEEVRRLEEEYKARLREEREARIAAERIAQLERNRAAQLEQDAREREEQRLRDEEAVRAWAEAESAKIDAELRAAAEEQTRQEAQARVQREEQWQREADEYIRQSLVEQFPLTHDGVNHAFQPQEAMAQTQAQEDRLWLDFWRDIPMGNPSLASVPDISMASILSDAPPTTLHSFDSYEARWKQLLDPNAPSTSQLLTWASIPWPVFQETVGSLDDLKDTDIIFFSASRYLCGVDKLESGRWQAHVFERLRSRIHPDYVQSLREGFLKCATVIDVFNAFLDKRL
jgi:hypothetical protein